MSTLKSVLSGIALIYFASCGSAPQTENKVEATEPVASTEQQKEPQASGNSLSYILQKEASTVQWMGSNKFTPKRHTGTVQFTEGNFTVVNNQLASGSFLVDMTTIHSAGDEYTEGAGKVGYLLNHLKSGDFFDVEKYPSSGFTITSVKPLEGNPDYNCEITGNMTIKGITKQITFPAKVEISGTDLRASAVFTFDRSQFDVRYGSESFFPDLVKDKLIRNEIELTLNLVAKQG